MKVNVNLYNRNGKWKYGGVVELSETTVLGSHTHKQELIDKQDFVVDGAFEDYFVVIQHGDDYDTDPSNYFCQHMYLPGAFAGMRKTER